MPEAIDINERVRIPETALRVTAVCASGPGGQNVNKVASKVELRVEVAAITGLDEAARARLAALAGSRLDTTGSLRLVSQKTRDQARNLADAIEKLRALVEAALVVPVTRRPTRPTRGSVRARLADKRRAADLKKSRGVRGED